MPRKATPKKKKSKHDADRFDRNKRIAIVTGVILAGGSVFVGASMGIGELDRQAARFIAPDQLTVQIDWPINATGSTWMPIDEREHIERQLAHAVSGGQALSQAPLKEAGITLMNTGWVEGTPTIAWTSDGQITVAARWRVPVAAVRVGNREIILDRDRHALPLDYAIGQSNLLFFSNVDARQPAIGEQWLGTDLQDGLKLLDRLERENLLEQVAGFDLGKGADSGTLKIITVRGARIIWGAGPGRERPGEQPTSVKIDRLKALFDRTGLIDAGAALIDIRPADILLQRQEGDG
jgi:hypothetical protein